MVFSLPHRVLTLLQLNNCFPFVSTGTKNFFLSQLFSYFIRFYSKNKCFPSKYFLNSELFIVYFNSNEFENRLLLIINFICLVEHQTSCYLKVLQIRFIDIQNKHFIKLNIHPSRGRLNVINYDDNRVITQLLCLLSNTIAFVKNTLPTVFINIGQSCSRFYPESVFHLFYFQIR